jgi:omega-6 fatty acid desaturase (delta-12 desaturase)
MSTSRKSVPTGHHPTSPAAILKSGKEKQFDVLVPPMTLTMRDIHEKIPAQYFDKITWKGFAYVARDLLQSAVTMYLMYYYGQSFLTRVDSLFHELPSGMATALTYAVTAVVWNLFWFVQGTNWTGLWVMAHECGHQSFSPYRSVNDTVGLILHSALLVPYHSWRITHGNHHKNTNHLTKDTVFVPPKKEGIAEIAKESPIATLIGIVVMLVFGWPAYLVANVSSQKYDRRANHFEPSSPLFRKDEASDIVLSDIGIAVGLAAIGYATYITSFADVFKWYLAPYLWVNAWLVFITYLQHSDARVPHYSHEEWNFVRGALATVDRDFGWILNGWLHHINDSHVVHHVFSQMPFYHAIQVTRKHIRGILGDLYLRDDRSIATSLLESWTNCRYVVPSEGVCVYRQ